MIKQTIQQDQIVAMKAKDAKKLETLRYILAQIKNKEVDTQKDITDKETVDVLRKEGKKLHESIDAADKAGRNDLSEEGKYQLSILTQYLPSELSDDDLKKKIQEIVSQNQEVFTKNPNALIGICVGKLKSEADPSRISSMVRSLA